MTEWCIAISVRTAIVGGASKSGVYDLTGWVVTIRCRLGVGILRTVVRGIEY